MAIERRFMKNYRIFVYFLTLFIFSIISTNSSANTSPTWRSSSFAGKFITAITWDKDNRFWIAAEEAGVTVVDKRTVKTFDIPYCYAIKCDNSGRVWIGSLRQGLFCYDYGEMKNYNTSNGLPTNSIYAIAFDKYNTPYCATGPGLAKLSEGKWEIIYLPDDLPKSEISCINFDREGNLWVGFFLGGVAKFDGIDWKLYTYKDGLGGYERINDLLVARDGTVWVTTCYGINILKPYASRWDYALMFQTYYPANYFLNMTEDDSGNILFANRHEAIIKRGINDSNLNRIVSQEQLPDSFVYCITTDQDGYIWAGTYGGGITTNNPSFKFPRSISKTLITVKELPLEKFSETPYQKELISKSYKLLKSSTEREGAYYIGEDWITRGDWIGNYGEYAWILCAYYHYYKPIEVVFDLVGGSDRLDIFSFKHIFYLPYIGENADPNDGIRGWLPFQQFIDNPKVLQDPLGGGRRHTEWDDHAESYERFLMREGPHIYLDLGISEEGIFIVSFYFMNKDGHEGEWNKFRDYTISVKRMSDLESEFEENPILANCRVHDFRAGVYKRFMLKGPAKYTIKFDKEESYNTCFSGVFIDKVKEP